MLDLNFVSSIVKHNILEKLFAESETKKIICFGTGEEAVRAKENELRDIEVEYFCDNYVDRYNTEFYGRPVHPQGRVREENMDEIVVVICLPFKSVPVIYRQLCDLGVKHIFASCLFSHHEREMLSDRFSGEYSFTDRRKGSENLLIILSGYKEYLWDIVFKRITRFLPSNYDVCILCAGRDVLQMSELAEKNGWSYLTTSENKPSLAQNIAIAIHKQARKVFRLDEDIFIAEGYFEKMEWSVENIAKTNLCRAGMLAPLIPVNVFGYIPFIEKLGLTAQMQKRFGERIAINGAGETHNNADFVRFLWDNTLPFDKLAQWFYNNATNWQRSPYRFSLCAILFKRKLWEEMGGFDVGAEGELGTEEEHISSFCSEQFLACYVNTNILAGHLSYAPQNEMMMEYFEEHKRMFDIIDA